MKIYARRDFPGRAYMCPSLGTEDMGMVVRLSASHVASWRPNAVLAHDARCLYSTDWKEGEFGYCARTPEVNSALVANHRSTSGAIIGVDTDAHRAIPRRSVRIAYAQGALASGAAREIREWWGGIWGVFGGSGDDLTSLRVGRIRLIHDIW